MGVAKGVRETCLRETCLRRAARGSTYDSTGLYAGRESTSSVRMGVCVVQL